MRLGDYDPKRKTPWFVQPRWAINVYYITQGDNKLNFDPNKTITPIRIIVEAQNQIAKLISL